MHLMELELEQVDRDQVTVEVLMWVEVISHLTKLEPLVVVLEVDMQY